MSDATPITTPSGYAPACAIGYADPGTNLILVSEVNRLPVATENPAPPPLSGSASASAVVGPFGATVGRVVSVTLEGDWQGTVTLQRSIDGGATLSGLKVADRPWAIYTASGCEQAWLETESGASYYLDIALASGTLTYQVSQ